jgi:hypothetical protein
MRSKEVNIQLIGAGHAPVADVEARMHNEDVTPTRSPRRVPIDWHDPGRHNCAHILHQLRILAAPGIVHLTGAKSADARDLSESFEVAVHRDWFGAAAHATLGVLGEMFFEQARVFSDQVAAA